MKICVEIFPIVGRLYRNPSLFTDVVQVSAIAPDCITIIPAQDSTPRNVTYARFYQLFGDQEGK